MPSSDHDILSPPSDIPKYIREPLQKQSPARLRLIAQYAEELADAKEHQQEQEQKEAKEENDQEDDVEEPDRNEDLPEEVPSKATITTKEINNNHYYYWQWREGDQIKSKYKGPVNPEQ